MKSLKSSARVTGVLFILGTATGVTAAALNASVLNLPNYLTEVASHEPRLLLAALLVMAMGVSCAGIGLSMYPVLKGHGQGLALGAAAFRVMEGSLEVASSIGLAALVAVGHQFANAGSPDASFFQPVAAAIVATNDWVGNGAYLFPWCIAAVIYYSVFYVHRMVPRWLSVWGLVGIALLTVSSLLAMFGLLGSVSAIQIAMNLPLAVQEMVLAVWLIVRGWYSGAQADLPAAERAYQ